MQSPSHLLGIVYATDEKSAETAAVAEFKIGADMRRRLFVRPDELSRSPASDLAAGERRKR